MPWGWGQQVSPKRCKSSAKIHDVICKKYVILTFVDCERNGRIGPVSQLTFVRGKLQCTASILVAVDVLCEGKQNELEERLSEADVDNLCL